ncbi:hypothetical protein [Sutcliffiella halmapala]|uniref:hypothetical protein n=1 Tax=Sutcliffiella halmapala TaxID=79882 RepID=UPI0009954B38|nr:hypothetical protein [Sutcliffiella halmapala]
MFWFFFTTLIISIILLFYLWSLKKRFDPLQLVLIFLFTSYICQNTYYKLFSPYDRISIADSGWAKLTVKLHFGIILPVLLIGVMSFFIVRKRLIALITSALWVLFVLGSEKLYLLLGVLELGGKNWYPAIDLCFAILLVFISIAGMKFLNRLLANERVIS